MKECRRPTGDMRSSRLAPETSELALGEWCARCYSGWGTVAFEISPLPHVQGVCWGGASIRRPPGPLAEFRPTAGTVLFAAERTEITIGAKGSQRLWDHPGPARIVGRRSAGRNVAIVGSGPVIGE